MRLCCLSMFAVVGCTPDPAPGGGADTQADPGSGFTADTPWEDATMAAGTLSGAFSVLLDDDMPGRGWFSGEAAAGRRFARARSHDVEGATWPVLVVEIQGGDAAGWDRLELDIATNRWVLGELPLDGQSAVGVLTTADGRTLYLRDGLLQVEAAGLEAGQRVAGRFEGVPLWEAP